MMNMPLQMIVVALAGWVNEQQLAGIQWIGAFVKLKSPDQLLRVAGQTPLVIALLTFQSSAAPAIARKKNGRTPGRDYGRSVRRPWPANSFLVTKSTTGRDQLH